MSTVAEKTEVAKDAKIFLGPRKSKYSTPPTGLIQRVAIMKRSLFQLPSLGPLCNPCRQRIVQTQASPQFRIRQKRLLNTTSPALADPSSTNDILAKMFQPVVPPHLSRLDDDMKPSRQTLPLGHTPNVRPHHLHIYATRHNCHITLSAANRDAILSVSAGNIGFKKAQRGSYDAAYQLGTYVMSVIRNQAMLDENYRGKGGYIKHLEVILRDFGPGREAVTKILLGSEGRAVRSRIVRVTDGTRLKFGGTRSKKRRRLG